MKFGIVVLAAGESSRMGKPKQNLTYGGITLLRRTVDHALSLDAASVFVVLGAFSDLVKTWIHALPVRVVENADWREGMGTSVRAGLAELVSAEPALEAVLFLVCDQPLVGTAELRALLEAHRASGKSIAAAEYSGTLGVPAIFARAHFPALLALAGNEGARTLIQRHRAETASVPMPAAAIDVDTPDEFAALPRGEN
jgi:molybdenum cofactor cytidylyltransferase